jgi:hypothetical protein
MKQPIQMCGSTARATYIAPTVESETFIIESGFASSPTTPGSATDPTTEDAGMLE